jgi:hypothetical protein
MVIPVLSVDGSLPDRDVLARSLVDDGLAEGHGMSILSSRWFDAGTVTALAPTRVRALLRGMMAQSVAPDILPPEAPTGPGTLVMFALHQHPGRIGPQSERARMMAADRWVTGHSKQRTLGYSLMMPCPVSCLDLMRQAMLEGQELARRQARASSLNASRSPSTAGWRLAA